LGAGRTQGDSASVIRTSVQRGDLDVLVTGDLQTQGDASRGVLATVVHGDARIEVDGLIETRGDRSQGIFSAVAGRTEIMAADIRTSGFDAVGIEAYSAGGFSGVDNDRHIDITAGRIITSGSGAHGIKATNPDGGIIISDADPRTVIA